jgi:hypothetical protein
LAGRREIDNGEPSKAKRDARAVNPVVAIIGTTVHQAVAHPGYEIMCGRRILDTIGNQKANYPTHAINLVILLNTSRF